MWEADTGVVCGLMCCEGYRILGHINEGCVPANAIK